MTGFDPLRNGDAWLDYWLDRVWPALQATKCEFLPTSLDFDLPGMRETVQRPDAYRRLSIFLRLPRLWQCLETQTGRLLRVLLLWRHKVSTRADGKQLLSVSQKLNKQLKGRQGSASRHYVRVHSTQVRFGPYAEDPYGSSKSHPPLDGSLSSSHQVPPSHFPDWASSKQSNAPSHSQEVK